MRKQKTRNLSLIALFGRKLKTIRNERQLSQEELGFKAGISTSQIARIETGKLNTTISTVTSLAYALDVSPGEFFQFADFNVQQHNNAAMIAN
jgi:transcriptional regulator with XRE-family HTH domain